MKMYKSLLISLFLFTVSSCSNNSSSSAPVQNSLISSNTGIFVSPTPASISSTINDNDFTVTKFVKSDSKKMTLDTQPPEIVKFILELETSNPTRLAGKINILVQQKDLNLDGIPERMIYFRQFDNKKGVPLFLIFKKDGILWDKNIYLSEGTPDDDIPEIEFLSKPDTRDFDVIKETFVFGDTTELNYLQMVENKYKKVDCRRITPAGSQTISCNN